MAASSSPRSACRLPRSLWTSTYRAAAAALPGSRPRHGPAGPCPVGRPQSVAVVRLRRVEADGSMEQLDRGLMPAVLQGEHPQQEDDIGIVSPVPCSVPAVPMLPVTSRLARSPRADHQDIRTLRHRDPLAEMLTSLSRPVSPWIQPGSDAARNRIPIPGRDHTQPDRLDTFDRPFDPIPDRPCRASDRPEFRPPELLQRLRK